MQEFTFDLPIPLMAKLRLRVSVSSPVGSRACVCTKSLQNELKEGRARLPMAHSKLPAQHPARCWPPGSSQGARA